MVVQHSLSYSAQVCSVAHTSVVREPAVVVAGLLIWISFDEDVVVTIDIRAFVVPKRKPLGKIIWVRVFWLCVGFTVVSASLRSLRWKAVQISSVRYQ